MTLRTASQATVLSRLGDAALPLGIMFSLLLVWEALVHLIGIKAYVLPAPTAIVGELVASGPKVILPQLKATLFETLAGYALAVAVAAVLSVLILYSSAFRRGVLPLIIASQTVPVITMAPVTEMP